MDLNKVTLIGNISKAPEQRTIQSGATVTKLNLATNYVWRDQAGTQKTKVDFHTVIAWNRLGERMKQYLKKGDKIYIEGRIDNHSYRDTEGKMHYYTDVIAQQLIMLGSSRGKKAQADGIVTEEVTTTEPLEQDPF